MIYEGHEILHEGKESLYEGHEILLEGDIRIVVSCMMWKSKSKKAGAKSSLFIVKEW